ncbi:MAG: rubrerythrin family protein [Lachnospiraceae bacterium]|nr:rubrerythrin family protein [Lachnospiraceae bacterium]
MDFISSETYKNIMQALAGELMTCAKYALYADKAYEDGYIQIGDVFAETSGNEKEHARILMRIMDEGEMSDTLDNLKEAFSGESNEWNNSYAGFAETARKEGFDNIAQMFENMAQVEKHHDFRFRSLADNIENGNTFCRNEDALWVCLNCGFLYQGACAGDDECPLCGESKGYYKLNCEDY